MVIEPLAVSDDDEPHDALTLEITTPSSTRDPETVTE